MKRSMIAASGIAMLMNMTLSSAPALARNVSASAGRPLNGANSNCWSVDWMGLKNTCTTQQEMVIPIDIDAYQTYTVDIQAYGSAATWTSCVAVAAAPVDGTTSVTYNVTSRTTTIGSTVQYGRLLFNGLTVFTDSSVYVDCTSMPGAGVAQVYFF